MKSSAFGPGGVNDADRIQTAEGEVLERAIEHRDVVAGSASEGVVARAAGHDIVAGRPIERVVARAADDVDFLDIVEFGHHRPVAGDDKIGTGAERRRRNSGKRSHRPWMRVTKASAVVVAVEHIGVGAGVAIDNITAVVHGLGNRVVALATGDDVIAAATVDQVVAREPKDSVARGGPGQRIGADGAADDAIIDAVEAKCFDFADEVERLRPRWSRGR